MGGGTEGQETLRALLRAEILSKAPYATTIECLDGRRGCAGYAIQEIPLSDRDHLFAVCTARRRPCPQFQITDEAALLGRITLSVRSLALALRRVFEVDGVAHLEDESDLLTLGEQEIDGKNPRNVYFLASPDYQGFVARLRGLERARRASLILLPTRTPVCVDLRSKSHGPEGYVEIDFLEDRVVLEDRELALVDDAGGEGSGVDPAVPTRARRDTASDQVRLALDCERCTGGMVITVNGKRWPLPDRHFALVVKLVSAQIRKPNPWCAYREVHIQGVQAATWHANRAFDPVVPAGFNVILNDRKRQCRLNPAVVVERVDWASVASHPDELVRKLAALHLSL